MKIVCRVLAIAALSCLSLFAQQITGNIRGTVMDPSGAVVRGAVVTVRQTETGLARSTTTDRNGEYVLLELPVGHYRLQVAAKGFQQYVQDGITLNVNETASVSPHLAIGSETVSSTSPTTPDRVGPCSPRSVLLRTWERRR